jgi:hypothetical protein
LKHKLFQTLLVAAFIICVSVMNAAAQDNQTPTTPDPNAAQQGAASRDTSNSPAQTRTNANETFELNITERRITKQDFNASTSVEAGEESARGLRLRIGVGVGAEQIDVLLRNVHGLVHFRGTLDRLLEVINTRRSPEITTP